MVLLWVALVIAVISGIDYFKKFLKVIIELTPSFCPFFNYSNIPMFQLPLHGFLY